MEKEKKGLEEQTEVIPEELLEEGAEKVDTFVPSPRWKRIGAWILFGVMVIAIINWLISIAYPTWPEYLAGLFQ